MKFDWLKRLFKRKKQIKENNKTSDVATIDTSLVYVPTFEELTEEEKENALRDLEILEKDDSYETLLKYSSDLVDISNRERQILDKTLERYYKWFGRGKNSKDINHDAVKLGESICYGLLSRLEFKEIEGQLEDVGEKLKIRAVALDLFKDKKEKELKEKQKEKKNLIHRLFDSANRLERENLRKRIECEKERIKVSMKLNQQILTTVYIDVNENDTLKREYEKLQQVSDTYGSGLSSFLKERVMDAANSILYSYSHDFIGTGFDDTFTNGLKEFANKLVGKPTPKAYIEYEIKYSWKREASSIITQEIVDYVVRNGLEGGEDYTFKPLLKLITDDMFEEFFKFLATTMHAMEVYRYEHRNDCKKYIEEIKNMVKGYETTPTSSWDVDKLGEAAKKYNYELYCYFKLVGDYLTKEEKREAVHEYSRLLFLCKLRSRKKYYDVYNWLHNYYNEFSTYDAHLDELIKKVEEKYGFSLYTTADKDAQGAFVSNYEETHLIRLVDYLQGNTNITDVHIKFTEFGMGVLQHMSCDKNFSIQREDSVWTEEFFYLMKFLNESTYDTFTNSLNTRSEKEKNIIDFSKFVALVNIKKLEEDYDSRILVVPEIVHLYSKLNMALLAKMEDLEPFDNQVAIYLSTLDQLEHVIDLPCESGTVKYIMVSQATFNRYMDRYPNAVNDEYKIIVVPDGTKYSRLSCYLDFELEKGKDKMIHMAI